MAKFWGTTQTNAGCSTAPDGKSHIMITMVQEWRFWRPHGDPYPVNTVGSGPCPKVGNHGSVRDISQVRPDRQGHS